MSILDTFYVLFKTDADKAAKEVESVKGASDKAADGLKKVDAQASRTGASFVDLAKKLAAPIAAMVSVGAAQAAIFGRFAQIREIDAFATKLNSTVEDVDAFRRSIVGMGGESQAALDSLAMVAEKTNEAFSDAESQSRADFQKWGVAFKDVSGQALGASDVLLNLAGSLEGVSRAEALARLKTLGIEDATTIDALLRGRKAMEDQIRTQREMGVITAENAARTRQFYEQMGRAKTIVNSWGMSILDSLIPAMTKGMTALGDMAAWARENKTLVSGFFIGIAGAVTAFYLPAMIKAGLATAAALWPILAIGGAVAAVAAAFALAYEDVVAFMNGQPSMIGELYEKYSWFAGIVDVVGASVRGIGDAISWVWNNGGWVLEKIGEGVISIGDAASTAARAVGDAFDAAFAWVKRQYDAYIAPIVDALGAVGSWFGGGKGSDESAPKGASMAAGAVPYWATSPDGVAKGQALLGAAAGAPINGTTSDALRNGAAPTVNRTSNVSVGEIKVTTQATDAAATGRAVRDELERYLRSTSAQLDDGVMN